MVTRLMDNLGQMGKNFELHKGKHRHVEAVQTFVALICHGTRLTTKLSAALICFTFYEIVKGDIH